MRMQTHRDIIESSRSLRTLKRLVDQLERRTGEGEGDFGPFADKDHSHVFLGPGPWAYDYLIDNRYTGPDGEIFGTFHGFSYRVYSSIPAAVAHANALPNLTQNDLSFFIIEGVYSVTSTIHLNPPIISNYHFFGSSPESTLIQADLIASDTEVFHVDSSFNDQSFEFQNVGFIQGSYSGSGEIKFIEIGNGNQFRAFNCHFYIGVSLGVAIDTGNDTRGCDIIDCYFEGENVGIGIRSDNARLFTFMRGCTFKSLNTGFYINNASFLTCSSNVFIDNVIGVHVDGLAFKTNLVMSANLFLCGSDCGILLEQSANSNSQISITGNIFHNISSNGIRCDSSNLISIWGANIAGNSFETDSPSAVGIFCEEDFSFGTVIKSIHNSIVMHNVFIGFTSGNEMIDVDGRGTEIMHNISTLKTGSPKTKQPLADSNSLDNIPVGHAEGEGSGVSEASGEFITSPNKAWANATIA